VPSTTAVSHPVCSRVRIALLHYCIIALLHYCIIALLHYCIASLHWVAGSHQVPFTTFLFFLFFFFFFFLLLLFSFEEGFDLVSNEHQEAHVEGSVGAPRDRTSVKLWQATLELLFEQGDGVFGGVPLLKQRQEAV